MTIRRTLALLVASGAALVSTAVPANAVATRDIQTGHVSVSAAGGLPVGATMSVVQHCPTGSTLDRAGTRALAPQADPQLRLASRELWVRGSVSRFRVVRATTAAAPTGAITTIVCRSPIDVAAKSLTGDGSTDLRAWGPAPALVSLINGTISVAGTEDSDKIFRTAMQAAGLDQHESSVADSAVARQRVFTRAGLDSVLMAGQTTKRLRPGQFASVRNRYTFSSDLTARVSVKP